MIKSISGIAFRFFSKNKFIAFSSIIGLVISIALIVTMSLFVVNAKQSLRDQVATMYGNMDLSVGYNSSQNKEIDNQLLNRIVSNQSIETYSSVLITRLVINQFNRADFYTVGAENNDLAKSRYHFTQDIGNSEIIIGKRLAESLKVKLGDTITVENKAFTIKEILPDMEAAGIIPDILILSKETVKNILYEKTGKDIPATYILIKAKKNSNVLTLASQIHQIDPALRIDIAEENEFLKNNLASLNVFMIVLSFLILIVTSLLIISNFDVFLYKYKNQFAIMRSLGADTMTMFKIVLIQSSIINSIGSIGGYFVALFFNRLLQNWLGKKFSFDLAATHFNYKIALMVTLISMIVIEIFMVIPSYKSSKVLPLKIIQDNEKGDFSHKRNKKKIGFIMVFISLFLIAISFLRRFSGEQPGAIGLLFAALILIIGVFILFPVYLPVMIGRLLPLIRLILGKTSYVAIKNIIPQVRKNTFVMLSICLMLIIAVFGGATIKTISRNGEQYLISQYPTNIVATSRLYYNSNIDHIDLMQKIKSFPGINDVSVISTPNQAEILENQTKTRLSYVMGDFKDLSAQGLLPNITGDIQNTIIFTEEFAKKNHIQSGDSVDLGLYSNAQQREIPTGTVKVAAIVKELPFSNTSAIMDWSNKTYITEFIKFNRAFINAEDPAKILSQLEVLKTEYPELIINSFDKAIAQDRSMFYQRWSIFIVVLIVMLICVMLGVFNSLINNIQSKRMEIAILRTISVSRGGVLNVILTQVLIYILLGSFLGVTIGIILTLILNLIDPGSGSVIFDFSSIAYLVVIMLGTALLIFIPYAWRVGSASISKELKLDNK